MEYFVRGVAWLSRACGVLSAALIGISAIVICEMVFLRYALRLPTIWQTEFVSYAVIAAVFLGSPYVLLHGGHVNVDLFSEHLKPRARCGLAVFARLLSLVFCVVVAASGYALWRKSWVNNWHSDSLWEVRLWIPYLAMPVGLTLVALQYLAQIMRLLGVGKSAACRARDDSS